MRAGGLIIGSGLLLAVVAGGTFGKSTTTKLDTPVVAACSVQGASCEKPALDESRQFVISHRIVAGGCPGADLHVMRYGGAETASGPLIATWCN